MSSFNYKDKSIYFIHRVTYITSGLLLTMQMCCKNVFHVCIMLASRGHVSGITHAI